MAKAQAVILIILLIIVLVVGSFFFLRQSSEPTVEIKEHIHDDSHEHEEDNNIKIIEESDSSGSTSSESENTQETKEFDVTVKKWDFDPGTITVNQGDNVILNIHSIDVAHGIAIPDFGVNKRLNPGTETKIEFIADKKGTFTFFCNVQCGSGHSSMDGKLIVE